MLLGAVRAAVKYAIGFHAVTNDPASAVCAGGCQRVDGAFETIENMRDPAHPDLKTLIVHVAAYFTSHTVCLTASFVHNLPLSSTIARIALS
jgi:hypothetical protein